MKCRSDFFIPPPTPPPRLAASGRRRRQRNSRHAVTSCSYNSSRRTAVRSRLPGDVASSDAAFGPGLRLCPLSKVTARRSDVLRICHGSSLQPLGSQAPLGKDPRGGKSLEGWGCATRRPLTQLSPLLLLAFTRRPSSAVTPTARPLCDPLTELTRCPPARRKTGFPILKCLLSKTTSLTDCCWQVQPIPLAL